MLEELEKDDVTYKQMKTNFGGFLALIKNSGVRAEESGISELKESQLISKSSEQDSSQKYSVEFKKVLSDQNRLSALVPIPELNFQKVESYPAKKSHKHKMNRRVTDDSITGLFTSMERGKTTTKGSTNPRTIPLFSPINERELNFLSGAIKPSNSNSPSIFTPSENMITTPVNNDPTKNYDIDFMENMSSPNLSIKSKFK
jgi:hypothetical protein